MPLALRPSRMSAGISSTERWLAFLRKRVFFVVCAGASASERTEVDRIGVRAMLSFLRILLGIGFAGHFEVGDLPSIFDVSYAHALGDFALLGRQHDLAIARATVAASV